MNIIIGLSLCFSMAHVITKKTILVTGGNGLVGSAVKKVSERYSEYEWVFLAGYKDGDLTSQKETDEIFEKYKPNYVIHLAANVGGLFKNMKFQKKMFMDNLNLGVTVLSASNEYKVEKVISCLSTCIFPNGLDKPINEDMLHDGKPHDSNYGYSYAKRMYEIMSRVFNEENEKKPFHCIIPTNVYGPHDNFSLQDGHVVPALIHKCYDAIKNNKKFVVCGTGKPLRQFIYSEDLANIMVKMLLSDNTPFSLIAANQREIAIGYLAETIAKEFGYDKSDIVYDTERADGQYKKTADPSKLNETFPDLKMIEFEEGIKRSVAWFKENYDTLRK
eukprot:GHVP01056581.1.p1 GENE.GHVP01056581.1~~GHVP01056581.1.p1  ORF type:complete len:332 (+),score=47.17 GHVP01056581.1:787-1782(+)